MPYILGGLFFIAMGLVMAHSRRGLASDVECDNETALRMMQASRRSLRIATWWFVGGGTAMVIAGGALVLIGAG